MNDLILLDAKLYYELLTELAAVKTMLANAQFFDKEVVLHCLQKVIDKLKSLERIEK